MAKKRIPGSVHVVFGSECTHSMDYKAIGVFWSFKTSGWKGNITRLLACSEEQKKKYKGWDIGPTFVHPNYHYVDGYTDSPTYNKPAALMHFTAEVDIEEEFILYIDSDMLLRRTVNPADYGARKGLVVTESVWYIKEGIRNGLAKQFLPDEAVERAMNTHGGYYHLFHVDDAKKVTPKWLHYTREMRLHPEKYWKGLPGSTLKEDIDTVQRGIEHGGVPWITEMYGYAFAAADVGLEHLFTRGGGGVLYGDDFLSLNHPGPIVSHYTLSCQIPSKEHYVPDGWYNEDELSNPYKFAKSEFRDFDPLDCDDGYLFPSPPRTEYVDEAAALCQEDAERLNFALCDFYRKRCPKESKAFRNTLWSCPYNVNERYRFHFDKVYPAPCGNQSSDEACKEAAKNGQCKEDPAWGALWCLKECGFCTHIDPKAECVDRLSSEECKNLKEEKQCLVNPTYATFNCRKTCNACPGEFERKLGLMGGYSDTSLNALVKQEVEYIENYVQDVEKNAGTKEIVFFSSMLLFMCFIFSRVSSSVQKDAWAAQSLSQRVAILGSGISGSSAARRLAENGLKVTVFEGGFGAGGRTSTRITRDEHQYHFDHGAQYIGSPKTKDFEKALLQWKSDGFVKDWSDGNFFTAKADLEVRMDEKKDRSVGYPKMSSICENLLKHENINLVTQTQARASLDGEGKWKLIHGKTKEDVGTFDWLIASDRNSANGRRKDLSSADVKDFATSVRKIKPVKSLTAMAVFDKPLDIGMDGVLFEGKNYGSLGWIARDSSKPGRERDDGRECWVIQTNPDAAKALLEGKESLDEIREIAKTVLVDDLLKVLPSLKPGLEIPEIQESMGHRWGAAFPINTNTEYAEMDSQIFESKKFVACGDYFGKYSGRIEGAYLSGISAADQLINATT